MPEGQEPVFPPEGGDDEPTSIGERAANGEHNDEPEQTYETVAGDHQLSLNLGAVSKVKKVTESTISLSSAERPIDGLLDVDAEYDLDVRVKVKHYETRPVRTDGVTKSWKQRQPVEVLTVRRVTAQQRVVDSFEDVLAASEQDAGKLLDDLSGMLKKEMAA